MDEPKPPPGAWMLKPQPPVRGRIVIVDPDPLTRRAIRTAFEDSAGFVVVAESADHADALALCETHRPDAVVIEPGLARRSDVTTIRALYEADAVPIVAFTALVDEERELEALADGAAAFVSKADGTAAAVAAVDTVLQGHAVVSPAAAMRLVQRVRELPAPGTGLRPVHSPLTRREWEVLDMIGTGATTADVAEQLVLSEETVYSHVKNLMRKLGVSSRSEAVEAAYAAWPRAS